MDVDPVRKKIYFDDADAMALGLGIAPIQYELADAPWLLGVIDGRMAAHMAFDPSAVPVNERMASSRNLQARNNQLFEMSRGLGRHITSKQFSEIGQAPMEPNYPATMLPLADQRHVLADVTHTFWQMKFDRGMVSPREEREYVRPRSTTFEARTAQLAVGDLWNWMFTSSDSSLVQRALIDKTDKLLAEAGDLTIDLRGVSRGDFMKFDTKLGDALRDEKEHQSVYIKHIRRLINCLVYADDGFNRVALARPWRDNPAFFRRVTEAVAS